MLVCVVKLDSANQELDKVLVNTQTSIKIEHKSSILLTLSIAYY